MTKKRKIMIPSHIWEDKNLQIMCKLFFIEIYNLCIRNGLCNATNRYFSELFGVTKGRCSQIITYLKKINLISVEMVRNREKIEKRNIKISETGLIYYNGGGLINDKVNNILLYNKLYNNNISDFDKKQNNSLVEFWNNLDIVQKHLNPKTKVYQQAVKYFKQLKAGSFGKNNYIEKTFLKKHNINSKLLSKKFSDDEIKEIMLRISDYHKPGFWPGLNSFNNMDIPKQSLSKFIYNPSGNTSIFFWLFIEKPKKEIVVCKNKNIFDKFQKVLKINNTRSLTISVNKLCDWWEDRIKNLFWYYEYTSFQTYFGTLEKFVDKYIIFLQKFGGTNLINILGYYFEKFLVYAKNYYNFNFDPDEVELEEIEKNWMAAKKRFETRN